MRGWESNIRNETALPIPRSSALSGIWSSVCSVWSNSARRHENLNWCFKNAYRFTERKTYIVLDGSAYRLRRTYGIKCILCFAEKKWEDCLEHLGGCGNRTSGSLFEMKLMWGFGKTPERPHDIISCQPILNTLKKTQLDTKGEQTKRRGTLSSCRVPLSCSCFLMGRIAFPLIRLPEVV